jgi:hypothetical protein
VNSIPIADGFGKEVIIQFMSQSINNNNTFYTDSMGMDMLPHTLNYRPTWNFSENEPVAGNYYPINSALYVEDINTNERMTVTNDRAQGGSSILNGEIELMIHRRLLVDDGRGVGEPLNETDWDGQGLRQFVSHWVQFSMPGLVNSSQRIVQFMQDQPTQTFLAPITLPTIEARQLGTAEPIEATENSFMGAVRAPLINDGSDLVKILTRTQNATTHLIRFHNMNDNSTGGTVVNVSTASFMSPFFGTPNVTEMSLNANQAYSTMILNKMNWNNYTDFTEADIRQDYLQDQTFTLLPQQIRTFLVQFPPASVPQSEELIIVENFITPEFLSA